MYKFFGNITLMAAIFMGVTMLASPSVMAETVEQKVRLQLDNASGGEQCAVSAVFKGDHDNCKNKSAKGREDCSKDSGCVCTRQEKHVSWQVEGKHEFKIVFDQGDANPFVQKGSHECKFSSNKKGQLRCRVKGKDVPKGTYRYSIQSDGCEDAISKLKIY